MFWVIVSFSLEVWHYIVLFLLCSGSFKLLWWEFNILVFQQDFWTFYKNKHILQGIVFSNLLSVFANRNLKTIVFIKVRIKKNPSKIMELIYHL